MFEPITSTLSGILVALGGLGILLGCVVKSIAGPDENMHVFGNRMIVGAVVGTVIVLLGSDVYDAIFDFAGK
jgi:hypothetical protein